MAADNTIDLTVNQKVSFLVYFNIADSTGAALDLSNYRVCAKYKPEITGADSTAKEFTVEITDAAAGEITISLDPEDTSLLKLPKYYYDIVITDNDTEFATRVIEGTMKVSPGVTTRCPA